MDHYVIGSVALGAALVGGGGLAHAEEVSVLPESEAVVAEAAAQEAPQVVEETPVVEEKTEEVPALYTAAGVETEDLEEEETLVEEEVPVITDSASDGVNESGVSVSHFEAAPIPQRIYENEKSLAGTMPVTIDMSIDITEDLDPAQPLQIKLMQKGNITGDLNVLTSQMGDYHTTVPLMAGGEEVGFLLNDTLYFDSKIKNHIGETIDIHYTRGIDWPYQGGENNKHVDLSLAGDPSIYDKNGYSQNQYDMDLYLNDRFVTRYRFDGNLNTYTGFSDGGLLKGYVETTPDKGLVFNHSFSMSQKDLPDTGDFTVTIQAPKGLAFLDDQDIFVARVQSEKVTHGNYRMIRDRFNTDAIQIKNQSITPETITLTLQSLEKPDINERNFLFVDNLRARATDVSNFTFSKAADGRGIVEIPDPVVLSGDPVRNFDFPDFGDPTNPFENMRNSTEVMHYITLGAADVVDDTLVEHKTIVEEDTTPFTRETRDNPDLAPGEEKVIQKGVDGLVRRRIEVTYENGVEVDRKVISTETFKEMVPEIVEVGTAKSDVRTYTKEESIPFKTEERENPKLPQGERKVIQEGVDGKTVITFEVDTLNGEDQGEPREINRETIDPINEIVEVGTAKEDVRTYTEEKSIPFKTEERENPRLPQGERKVIQEGKNGKTTITFEVDTLNGEDQGEPREIDRQVIDPVNEIVEVGTGVSSTRTYTETEAIAFTQVEEEDDSLLEGERQVIQTGIDGVLEITYEVDTFNGENQGEPRETGRRVRDVMVPEVVLVGTKVIPLTPLEPAEEVQDAAELVPAEQAEDAAELVPAEKAEDAAELTPAEKAQDAAELTPAEEAMDAAELEPAILEAPEVIENAPEIVESQPEVVPLSVAQLPETGEDDDFVVLGLASLGLLAGIGLVGYRKENA